MGNLLNNSFYGIYLNKVSVYGVITRYQAQKATALKIISESVLLAVKT